MSATSALPVPLLSLPAPTFVPLQVSTAVLLLAPTVVPIPAPAAVPLPACPECRATSGLTTAFQTSRVRVLVSNVRVESPTPVPLLPLPAPILRHFTCQRPCCFLRRRSCRCLPRLPCHFRLDDGLSYFSGLRVSATSALESPTPVPLPALTFLPLQWPTAVLLLAPTVVSIPAPTAVPL